MKTYCFLTVAACCIMSVSPAVAQIYFNDFETAAGSEWSNTSTDTTPIGARNFLGQFGNQIVSLSGSVPAGNVTVSFDLFLIQSWDGNGDHCCGPDVFDVSVVGGPTLLHTTFANVPASDTDQAYPDAYPGGGNTARSDAAENNTLGYSFHGDSVYNLSFTFPHTGGYIELNFSASGLQGISDESWGLDNVLVELEIEVEIDIKPGSFPSSINLKKKGVTPVAIHTTQDPAFDTANVDPSTVLLGTVAPVSWLRYDCDEIPNPDYGLPGEPEMIGDEDVDLVLYFDTQELVTAGVLVEGLTPTTEVTLTGGTFGGAYITGTGDVSIVVKGKP